MVKQGQIGPNGAKRGKKARLCKAGQTEPNRLKVLTGTKQGKTELNRVKPDKIWANGSDGARRCQILSKRANNYQLSLIGQKV